MLFFILNLPLFGVFVSVCLRVFFKKFDFFRVVGLSFFLINLIFILFVSFLFIKNAHIGLTLNNLLIEYFVVSETFNLTLALSVDGFSLSFLLLSSLIFSTCGLALWRRTGDVFGFLCLLFLLQFFVSGFFLAQDLLSMYVFFEASVLPMFLLIGRWGSGNARVEASYYFLMYTVAGSSLMLYAIASIYLALGTVSFEQLINLEFSETTNVFYFWFFFLGFAVKVPLFPLHLWLPEAHVQAPTEGSVILSGVLLKMGIYGIYRVCFCFFEKGCFYYAPVIRSLAVFGVIYSSLSAFVQFDIKRIIAYSSVAHTNLALLGLFSFTQEGVHGALLLSFAHGLVSAGLFFMVGFLYDRHGTRNISYFGGLSQVMPLYATFLFIFLLCNVSVPLSLNFVGEFLIFVGLMRQSFFLCVLAGCSLVLGLVYSLWFYLRTMFGSLETTYIISFSDLTKVEVCLLAPYAVLSIFLGIYPTPLLALLFFV